jgi:NAD(P)H dehydrogenase (quinone)
LRADSSVLGLAGEHREAEADIRASGVPYVFLRNGWYTENYAMGIPTALSLGAVYGCADEGRISSAARADYAEAAAVALTSDGQAGKTYELAGDSAYTLSEFAAEISRQSGKAINYVNLPETEYKKALLGAGLPELLAQLLADSDTGVSKGALFDEGRQLSKLIGRATTPMAVSVKAAL